MFGVLDRYIGKTIFNTIIMTLFMLVSLSGIIKFVDQLRKVGQGEYTALSAGMFTLLSVPKDIEIFFPMAALLGALLGLGQLATRSELVVMQASGHFNDQRRLETVRYAATASFEDGVWKLSQVDTSDLTNEKQVTGTQTLTGEWKTNLTPDKLGVVALDPTSLSISGLHNYVKYLKQSGQEANRYQLNMWSKVFSPLSVAVMMLMALSFIFGPLRSVPMGVRVVTGISFGFLFYVLDQIFGPLSLVYNMPPVLGALLPSMLFLLISVYMLLKRK